MDEYEQLFNTYPGLQNYYENAVAAGYQGTPADIYNKFIEEMTGRMPSSNVMEYNNALAGGYTGTLNDYINSMKANAGAQTLLEAVSPEKQAYQRSLLSGSTQPNSPYGFGLAGTNYYGYPRNNAYNGILY